jgi:hypothetical protein
MCIVCTFSYGQIGKGTKMIGGSVGIEFETDKTKTNSVTRVDSRSSSLVIAPQVGYFLGLGLRTSATKYLDDDTKTTSTSVTLEPFIRYYLPQKIYFEAKFDVGAGNNKYKTDDTTDTDKYSIAGWSLLAGYAYFLNDNVALEPQIGYESLAFKNKGTSTRYVDGGLFLRLGLQVYLR